ncbi:MAG: TPR end-of-group domain-containing protein, partial [Myxococcales bacterium]
MPLALLLASLLAADALGVWTANGARLELKEEGGKVVGRLAASGGPCALPAGTELLKGTLLDDSLSAQVRLCVVAEKCGAVDDTALAVLLVTRTLTGGVHTKAACAQDVHALVLRRPGPAPMMKAPAPTERLSGTPPPKSPRVVQATKPPPTQIAANAKLPTESVAVGQIAGRPVGEPEHPAGYDPRDARKAGTPQGQADKLLVEGAAYLQEGRFEKARALFQKSLEKDPQRAEAYNGVGVTYYARGDYDEALAWYKRSLEADPRFGDAFYNMACVYALQQHRELAFRYLRMAALNHYSEREAMEKDPDLASLKGEPQWREIVEQMK